MPLWYRLSISETLVTNLWPLKGKDIYIVEFTPARIKSALTGPKALHSMFTQSIEENSGVKLQWNVLDLSGDTEMGKQVEKIQQWGHVAAFVDDGKASPN